MSPDESAFELAQRSETVSRDRTILLAAGGTGGHLFPAEALADTLGRRGVAIALATDTRGGRYDRKFPAREIHVIPSETLRARDPVSIARTAAMLALGLVKSFTMLGRV